MRHNLLKKKPSKVFNFVLILIFIFIWLYAIYQSPWFLFLLIVPIAHKFLFKIKIKIFVIYLIISLIPIILFYFIKQYLFIEHISTWLDHILHFSCRDGISHFINNQYDTKTADFLNLLLLNIKQSSGYDTYQKMIDLSIVYLIVISGLHLSFMKILIFKLIKIKYLKDIISLSLIFLYSYLLKFSISSTRVLITYVFSLMFRKNFKNYFDIVSLGAIFIVLCGPSCVFNYGFCMSYGCTFAILTINKLPINSELLKQIVISIVATLICLPFVILMNQQISVWAVINSFMFGYIFMLIFVYFLLTFLMFWLAPLHLVVVSSIHFIVDSANKLNMLINIKNFSNIIQTSFFLIICMTLEFLYYKHNLTNKSY
ncbi:MAG: ComEC/Rec2 family competence protein [Mycoplasmataceae bacterium]|nr:ComEC/Rec2 family competence protein [Mycoplasmataceae bacterium]